MANRQNVQENKPNKTIDDVRLFFYSSVYMRYKSLKKPKSR